MQHMMGVSQEGHATVWGESQYLEAARVDESGGGGRQVTKLVRKARLQYHPDRYQTAELEEQIRAEEIFKLLGSLL